MNIDSNLVLDFLLANVLGEILKYLTSKVASKVDSQNKTFLDVE